MDIAIEPLLVPPPEARRMEIVERKGLGHPDSLCDALAEALSLSLSRFYLENFGLILHHNVDKALLWGGQSRPAFGGGEITKPIEIYLSGRATFAHRGITAPVEEIAQTTSAQWLSANLSALDPARHVIIHPLVRPGSHDLVELFLRAAETGEWLANDTSIGVGYAPLSSLERTVLAVEQWLMDRARRAEHLHVGEDVKVMGVRNGRLVELTVACAFVGQYVSSLDDYAERKTKLAAALDRVAADSLGVETVARVVLNAADDIERGSIYLTVTGTSAEAGDDGQAGRGNRVNGLITPHRPMTMESVAGKNPITHVGKLYNLAAGLIAHEIVETLPEIAAAEVYLVSQIGRLVADPAVVEVRIAPRREHTVRVFEASIEKIVRRQMDGVGTLWRDLLSGEVVLNRWPLRQQVTQPK